MIKAIQRFTSLLKSFERIDDCSSERLSKSFEQLVGQLRINFTSIFKVFTKLPESRSDEGNLENFENTSEINP